MSAATLLPRLAAAGIEAWSEGGRVRLRGREPTPDLLAELRARRADLLAELAGQECGPVGCEDWTPAVRAIRDARDPAPGTPERTRLDRDQAAACAGLLASFRRHAGGGR